MPKISPFRAARYNAPNKDLSVQVCPPYDIIDQALEKKLKKNSRNAIHIELPDGSLASKYKHAKKVWDQWNKNQTVVQDDQAAFYVYQQDFTVEKKKYSRTGFFCQLQVEKPGAGSILRHELTLAGPKLDRLNLLRALNINTSPIFGLFPDPKAAAQKIYQTLKRTKALSDIKDKDGVRHQLWALTDAAAIATLQKMIAKNPVAIADGHHRYETAWNYAQESKVPGADSALFFLCAMEEPGLVIFPTHRIVRQNKQAPRLQDVLDRVKACGSLFVVRKERAASVPKHKGLLLTNGKEHFSITVGSESQLKKQFAGKPKEVRELSLHYIHQILLPSLQKEDFLYSHDFKETLKLMRKNKTFAILVPPVSTQELFKTVVAGELMPQKSTYFYPKIVTGILFRALQ